MNKFRKPLCLVCAALTLCFAVTGCGKKDYIKEYDAETTTAYEPWKESFTKLYEEEETTWASYTDAMKEQIAKIEAMYGIEGIYLDKSADEKSPTAIVSYKNSDENISVSLLKFKDSKLYKEEIDTENKAISENCNFFVVDGMDYVILRYIDIKGESKQFVYGMDDGQYGALRVMRYDNDTVSSVTSSMDSDLKEFLGKDFELISFAEKAVTKDVSDYLKTTFGIEN